MNSVKTSPYSYTLPITATGISSISGITALIVNVPALAIALAAIAGIFMLAAIASTLYIKFYLNKNVERQIIEPSNNQDPSHHTPATTSLSITTGHTNTSTPFSSLTVLRNTVPSNTLPITRSTTPLGVTSYAAQVIPNVLINTLQSDPAGSVNVQATETIKVLTLAAPKRPRKIQPSETSESDREVWIKLNSGASVLTPYNNNTTGREFGLRCAIEMLKLDHTRKKRHNYSIPEFNLSIFNPRIIVKGKQFSPDEKVNRYNYNKLETIHCVLRLAQNLLELDLLQYIGLGPIKELFVNVAAIIDHSFKRLPANTSISEAYLTRAKMEEAIEQLEKIFGECKNNPTVMLNKIKEKIASAKEKQSADSATAIAYSAPENEADLNDQLKYLLGVAYAVYNLLNEEMEVAVEEHPRAIYLSQHLLAFTPIPLNIHPLLCDYSFENANFLFKEKDLQPFST